MWHCRLGHCAFDTINILKQHGQIEISHKTSTSDVCKSYHLAKATTLPFNRTASRSTSPFSKIHCDLWGPTPILSIEYFRYYVTFIDDCTRFTWFYPLYCNSGFFSIFLQFKKLIDKQFSAKMKRIQIDGGGEFMAHKVQAYLVANVIINEVSCPYTPTHKSLVERRHRSIVEIGLAQLFHNKAATKFWDQSFQIAAYKLNRRPTAILSNSASPYFLLFRKNLLKFLVVAASPTFMLIPLFITQDNKVTKYVYM